MRHAYIDEHSHIKSFIHQFDPRIKIVSFITFILFVLFTRPGSFKVFGLYGALMAVLILVSKIPISFILKKSLVIIPFVLVMAFFIPFVKSGKVAGGYSLGTLKLTVTYDGLMIFWNCLIKAYLSALSMILLITSTKFSVFLKALERLKCPLLFTMIFSFMYRYIFVVEDELLKMEQAREARSVAGSRWFQARALANMLGILFVRTYERGEKVYLAMCSRGFDGRIRTMDDFKLRMRDLCFLAAIVSLLTAIRILGS